MGYIRISWQRGSVATATLWLHGLCGRSQLPQAHGANSRELQGGRRLAAGEANPQGSLSSTWWLDYHDDQLSKLIDQALHANQTIIAADAAYRLAQATVSASTAPLFPTVSANASATRAEYGSAAASVRCRSPGRLSLCHRRRFCELGARSVGEGPPPDRVQQAGAEASDAQRAGQRLSIAATCRQ